MSIFVSRSENTFFDSDYHTDIPDDSVEITREAHGQLYSEMCMGKVLDFDALGNPFTKDAPPPSRDVLAAEERFWRDRELSRVDVVINRIMDNDTTGITGSITLWREYRIALRKWPEHSKFPDVKKRPVPPDRGVR